MLRQLLQFLFSSPTTHSTELEVPNAKGLSQLIKEVIHEKGNPDADYRRHTIAATTDGTAVALGHFIHSVKKETGLLPIVQCEVTVQFVPDENDIPQPVISKYTLSKNTQNTQRYIIEDHFTQAYQHIAEKQGANSTISQFPARNPLGAEEQQEKEESYGLSVLEKATVDGLTDRQVLDEFIALEPAQQSQQYTEEAYETWLEKIYPHTPDQHKQALKEKLKHCAPQSLYNHFIYHSLTSQIAPDHPEDTLVNAPLQPICQTTLVPEESKMILSTIVFCEQQLGGMSSVRRYCDTQAGFVEVDHLEDQINAEIWQEKTNQITQIWKQENQAASTKNTPESRDPRAASL
jgi:hypothetical protein